LISSHNCFAFYDFTRPGITHCCVQTTQVEHASEWIGKYQKPLVYDECCYEGNLQMSWGNISGFEMVNRFWLACAQGAYASHGEVFLAGDEVLWWSKGGVLKGESPRRIAFLRGIIEGLPGFIEPWPFDPMALMDEEMKKAVLNSPFPKLYAALPEAQKESQLVKDATPRGRVGDKVFIQYLARHCNALLTWLLPSDKKYRVEVVDVWEMTRKTILTGVTGVIEVKLPGKEGIAVIARVEN
jgi:hypothetical protein